VEVHSGILLHPVVELAAGDQGGAVLGDIGPGIAVGQLRIEAVGVVEELGVGGEGTQRYAYGP
jgi:hypothetical protein